MFGCSTSARKRRSDDGDRLGVRVVAVDESLEHDPAVGDAAIPGEVDPAQSAVVQTARDLVLAGDQIPTRERRPEREGMSAAAAEPLHPAGIVTDRPADRTFALGTVTSAFGDRGVDHQRRLGVAHLDRGHLDQPVPHASRPGPPDRLRRRSRFRRRGPVRRRGARRLPSSVRRARRAPRARRASGSRARRGRAPSSTRRSSRRRRSNRCSLLERTSWPRSPQSRPPTRAGPAAAARWRGRGPPAPGTARPAPRRGAVRLRLLETSERSSLRDVGVEKAPQLTAILEQGEIGRRTVAAPRGWSFRRSRSTGPARVETTAHCPSWAASSMPVQRVRRARRAATGTADRADDAPRRLPMLYRRRVDERLELVQPGARRSRRLRPRSPQLVDRRTLVRHP